MMFRRNRHPVTTGRFQALLARRSILQLLLIYFTITAISSLLFGVLYLVTDTSNDISCLGWWFYAAVQHLGLEPAPRTDFELVGVQHAVFLVSGAMGIVFPVLLLSSFVFKLFINTTQFVFSKYIWLHIGEKTGRHMIIFRFYNSGILDLFYTDATLNLRVIHSNIRKSNKKIGAQRNTNAIKSHMIKRVYAYLEPDDVRWVNGKPELISVQGKKITEGSTLSITARGEQLHLGISVLGYKEYKFPDDLICGRPKHIEEADRDAWQGWDRDYDPIKNPNAESDKTLPPPEDHVYIDDDE